MPNHKKELAAAVTKRSRRFRARRRLRNLLGQYDSVVYLDLIQFLEGQRLEPGTWVSAEEFASSYLTAELRKLVLEQSFSGVEVAAAKIGGKVIKLIRPAFIPSRK